MVERNRQQAKWLLKAVFISCAASFPHSASAQLVSSTGEVLPGSVQTPNWTVGGDLTVGDTTTGSLTIDAGATVSNDLATIGNLNGAVGTLTVSGRNGGAASTWTSAGLVSVGVESGSQGTLKVQAGGQARSDAGIIGRDSGSVGTVTVSGVGSVWELSTINSFQIGTAGSGTLRIDDGGAVHSGQGIIGWQPGGNGRVTVTGARSVWDPLNNIYVGFEGTGELQVQDGAAVHTQGPSGPTSAASIYIGLQPGGVGTVNVSSTTANASTLKASDRIEIGSAGTGTLTIDKGGIAGAAADTWIAVAGGSTGTLHLLGDAGGRGALETGSVVKGLAPRPSTGMAASCAPFATRTTS